jgi:transposase-like protein
VAVGLRPDGKKEVIDFRLASAESAAQWDQFLGDLIRRGLTGERLEMLCVDGGSGLLAALPTASRTSPSNVVGRTRSATC